MMREWFARKGCMAASGNDPPPPPAEVGPPPPALDKPAAVVAGPSWPPWLDTEPYGVDGVRGVAM